MRSKSSGFVSNGHARLYYEVAGEGPAFVMIHAGIADSRQWNNEFTHFANNYRVLRYDMRGYGRSEPAEGEFSHMGDLMALLDHLQIREPLVMMGCSMGGGLAMDFALTHPLRVKALIMVVLVRPDWNWTFLHRLNLQRRRKRTTLVSWIW